MPTLGLLMQRIEPVDVSMAILTETISQKLKRFETEKPQACGWIFLKNSSEKCFRVGDDQIVDWFGRR